MSVKHDCPKCGASLPPVPMTEYEASRIRRARASHDEWQRRASLAAMVARYTKFNDELESHGGRS